MTDSERMTFMQEAIRIASDSVAEGGGPFGAVVVREGMVIARGRNRVTELGDPTAHAEVLAIREACRVLGSFRLSGCEIYASSEPCPMCLGAIYWARPLAVYFAADRRDAAAAGFDDSFIYEEMRKSPEERSLPIRKLPAENAGEPFKRWRSWEDRIDY